jgi:DNA segregation ATPase FtsK/SpoIIIE, S-DNA-T family
MTVYPRNKSREILGGLLLTLTVALSLSLVTYSPFDQSLNVSSPFGSYENRFGPAGAWTADFLFQLFGGVALLLPIPLLIVGYKKLRGRPTQYPSIKALGLLGMMVSLCCLVTFVAPTAPDWANFASGGIVGVVALRLAVDWFNQTGAVILAAATLILSLVLTTRFSIEGALSWVSKRRPAFSPGLASRWRHWRERRRQRSALDEVRRTDRKLVAQAVPRQVVFDDARELGQHPSPRETGSGQTSPPPVEPPEKPVLRKPAAREPLETEPTWTDEGAVRPGPDRIYRSPSLDFLQDPPDDIVFDEAELIEQARKLATKCAEFDVLGRVLQIHPGPVVTTFEFKPDPGVKYSRITNLADDLCLGLRAESVRIDRVPGKNTVGIEVPNARRRIISLKEILASTAFQKASSRLTLGLGQLINGATYVTDLSRMPHLLIAGSTGSGKSVGLNCMVCSILYKADPDEVRFIMVDPKRLELGLYEDIPHLLTPIVTDPKKAANALNWAVREMEERYRTLARMGVRNIAQYNALTRESRTGEAGGEPSPLPAIVIIVDELADLMMTAGKDVEWAVTRLAQMARAVGIHLILATQRPSVDVITGLIKANFPSRISFRVSSKVDSRTILDANGAELLLGMGDMLFLSPGTARLTRIHGAFVSEKEIARIVKFLRDQGEPDYREEILLAEEDESEGASIDVGDLEDRLFDEAARFVVETRKASTSLLQRRFRIGYGRAARLLDIMEHEGIVGPPDGSRPREVLVPPNHFEEID